MKILVISDNHGDEYILEEILSIYEDDVDSFIHCGDSEMKDIHPLWQQYNVVRGNMDVTQKLDTVQVDQVDGKKFFFTHGHRCGVKQSRQQLVDMAKDEGAEFAFYGHTHVPKVEKIDGVYAINPGSITQPRGGYNEGTYCIIDILEDSKKITYYTRDHNEFPVLSQELNWSSEG